MSICKKKYAIFRVKYIFSMTLEKRNKGVMTKAT